ncbi:hypothetical protein BDV29DRAFT_200658 [Aspergillus leporis]|uniref:Uncharacterized protein n=1 Tax=Aspergillus leporis TaxID=41062 RepID=A0A5N5WG26_9EURO|nr:hypothetical protein BDV29DRAFT_200658 [Aspergillus leporis]
MSKPNWPPQRLDKRAAFGQDSQQPQRSRKGSKEDDNLNGTTLNHQPNSSAGSSVFNLDSPTVVASSTGSSSILTGLGILGRSNIAAGFSDPDIHLSKVAEDYPAPLVPSSLHRAVSPCKSEASPGVLAYTGNLPRQVINKPLPPVPPLAPTRARGGKERALPVEPLPYHLAALDKAFERAGLVRDISPLALERPGNAGRQKAVPGVIGQDLPSVEAAGWAARLYQPWRAIGWLPRQRTDTAQSASRADTERTKPSKPNISANQPGFRPRTLGRLLQRLHLPWPSHRGLLRPDSSSTLPEPPSRNTIGEFPTRQSLSEPTPGTSTLPGTRPSRIHCRPVDRMRRVLSALVEERISVYLTGSAEIDQERHIHNLLQQAQQLLLDGLQQVPCEQGAVPLSLAPATHIRLPPPNINASIPSAPVIAPPRCSTHELDGRPLTPCVSSALGIPVMLRILWEINCLEDLFSMALVNREAYQAFKENELLLMKATLWKVSPPAWELLQVNEIHWERGPLAGSQSLEASLYLRHYTRNLYNLTRIKFLILDHCQAILRPDTIAVLRDPYSGLGTTVDAAIWRVWTFCHLFGSQKGREWDIVGQTRWLQGDTLGPDLPSVCCTSPDANDANTVLFIPPAGFAQGNQGELSKSELCKMVEIWTAIAALLDFLRDETGRARSVGIFDKAHVTTADTQQERSMLRAWLHFILTLGPTAVLELAPSGPYSDPDAAFQRASSYGWTDWTPPTPGSHPTGFLTGAIQTLLSTST